MIYFFFRFMPAPLLPVDVNLPAIVRRFLFFMRPEHRIPEHMKKGLAFLQVLMELMTGFEPVTSSLPRMRSTD